MRNKTIALMLAIGVSLPVHATGYTARQLLEIQSETAYLKAQVELAKARNDLATAQGGSPATRNTPQVVSIIRFGDQTSARLRLSDGAPIEVRVGDRLPDGSAVIEIRANGVRISKHGKSQDLAFVTGAAAAPSGTVQQIPPIGIQ